MKIYFIALFSVLSLGAYASDNCTYFLDELGQENEKLSESSYKMAQRKMERRGYVQTEDKASAAYHVTFVHMISERSEYKSLFEKDGSAFAMVMLSKNDEKHTLIASPSRDGSSGYLGGVIGKNTKNLSLLSRSFHEIPDCSEL